MHVYMVSDALCLLLCFSYGVEWTRYTGSEVTRLPPPALACLRQPFQSFFKAVMDSLPPSSSSTSEGAIASLVFLVYDLGQSNLEDETHLLFLDHGLEQ